MSARPFSRIFLVLSLALGAPLTAQASGVVVDEVAPASEIEKAGLEVGDLLLGWERPPAPPANPDAAQGLLNSPFDWMWLEVEQAHRGAVWLHGERKGDERTWRVAPGEWNVHFNAERRGRSRVRPRFLEGEEAVTHSWLLLREGELLGERGEWQEARAAFERAKLWAPDDRVQIFLWEALGKSFEYEGRFQEASVAYREGLILRSRTEPDSLGLARSLHQLGSQQRNLGRLERTRELWDQALELRARWAPGSFLEADSLHAQGFLALDRGNLEAAEHFIKRAVTIQEQLGRDTFWMAFKLDSLGSVYGLRGDLEVAARHYERALAIRQRLVPRGESVAINLVRLGEIDLQRGLLPEARGRFEQAMELLERHFPDQPMVGSALHRLGEVALLEGDLAAAERCYRRALDFLGRLAPGHFWSAPSWNGLAEVATRRGDDAAALAHLQRALQLYRQAATGTAGEAGTLAALGRTLERLGDRAGAARHFRKAMAALAAQVGRLGGSEDVKADYRALRRNLYFDAVAIELKLGRPEVAFEVQESARAQGFLALVAGRERGLKGDVPQELEEERRRLGHQLRRALASLNGLAFLEDRPSAEAAVHDLPLLREQLEAVWLEIGKRAPRLPRLSQPRILAAEEIARELDPGMVAVAFQVGEIQTHAFVLSAGGEVTALALPVGAEALDQELERLRGALAGRRIGRPADPNASLRQLYRWLLAPLEGRLEEATRLLILPDGPLHGVPWGALIRDLGAPSPPPGRAWQYLVEWKPYFTALSATVWVELKRSRGARPLGGSPPAAGAEPGAPVVAAFGDPIFAAARARTEAPSLPEARLQGASGRGPDFTPLPGTRREVEAIASLLPGQVAVHLGAEATEERVKALPRGIRILHLATHGFADERLPLNSGLVLTLPARFEEQGEDGLLQAWEIYEGLRLDADLVVLSACETGLGREAGGEGLLGLTRAFQVAGVGSVVASLWKVDDQAAAELMVRFYRHLKAGEPTAEALRAAQLELLALPPQPGGADFASPAAWAAFQVYGDGG